MEKNSRTKKLSPLNPRSDNNPKPEHPTSFYKYSTSLPNIPNFSIPTTWTPRDLTLYTSIIESLRLYKNILNPVLDWPSWHGKDYLHVPNSDTFVSLDLSPRIPPSFVKQSPSDSLFDKISDYLKLTRLFTVEGSVVNWVVVIYLTLDPITRFLDS
jgi:hypothetical protein